MRKWMWMVMMVTGRVFGQTDSFRLAPIQAERISLGVGKATSLVFPVGVLTGTRVSGEIAARKLKGVENVVELRALRRNFNPTNLMVVGEDGRLYCFDLVYGEDSVVRSYQVVRVSGAGFSRVGLVGFPVAREQLRVDAGRMAGKRFLHVRRSAGGMVLSLRGLYWKDSLVWLVIGLRNHSMVPYESGLLRMVMVDRHRVKRGAEQEIPLEMVYERLPGVVPGEGKEDFAVGVRAFRMDRSKRLVIEMGERNGVGVVRLTVNGRMLRRIRAYKG